MAAVSLGLCSLALAAGGVGGGAMAAGIAAAVFGTLWMAAPLFK
jgi:hypothetical protein